GDSGLRQPRGELPAAAVAARDGAAKHRALPARARHPSRRLEKAKALRSSRSSHPVIATHRRAVTADAPQLLAVRRRSITILAPQGMPIAEVESWAAKLS